MHLVSNYTCRWTCAANLILWTLHSHQSHFINVWYFLHIRNLYLELAFLKKLKVTPPPKYLGNQPSSFATVDLITWFYSPKSWWWEAFWDDFFWEVDIFLKPSLFVGRGTYKDRGSDIITLNWRLLKSTYVWGHCAVQIVSWLVLHGGASQKF